MAYLLDADAFIRAKRLHYGFSFCPAFWDWLIVANSKRRVFSVNSVYDQLIAGTDELSDWARQRRASFFKSPDEQTIEALDRVGMWVQSQSYEVQAIRTFMQDADYWLIAEALSGSHTVVTHEVRSNSRKKVKIPNVCDWFGIGCQSPFEMLSKENARFILGQA